MVQKDTYTSMVIAALFTIAKTRKQSKRPLTEAWIKKIRYIHRMEYYSAIEKNEIVLLAGTWTDLECHAGGSQSEGEVSHDIPYMQNLKRNDTSRLTHKTERDSQT